MNEEYIKKLLIRSNGRLGEIHSRVYGLYKELQKADDLLESIVLRGNEFDTLGIKPTRSKAPDMLLMLDKHKELAEERSKEIRLEMWQLTDEQESINRIWACFQALDGKEYEYLEQLYVKNRPYKSVEAESGVSHGTFEKTRKRAIKRVLQLYESEMSNMQIIKFATREDLDPRKEILPVNYTQETLNFDAAARKKRR